MRHVWRGALLAAAAGLCAVAAPLLAKDKPSRLVVVTMGNLAFAPQSVTAHVGDRVAWINHDIFLHSATTPDFDVVLKPGATAVVRLLKPGVISYICRYHPGMTGKIVVTE